MEYTSGREELDLRIGESLINKVVDNEYLFTNDTIESVKNILGLDFYSITKFVEKEVFNFDENKCTVLVTRRCLLLVDWFIGYIIYQKSKDISNPDKKAEYQVDDDVFPYISINGKKNFLLSDKADVSLLADRITKVTILDDICIHGITLSKTARKVEKILDGIQPKKHIEVKTCVYMYSKETISEYPDRFYKISMRADWKSLSMKILDFVNFLNLPYVSYLNSWTTPDFNKKKYDELINVLSKSEDLVCEKFNEEYNRLGKFSYFIYEKQGFLREFELVKCIRIYYSERINSICVMPYVLLKSIDSLKKEELRNLINSYINIDSKRLNDILDKGLDYIYSFLSYIASQAYGKVIFSKYKTINTITKKAVHDNISCLEKLFGVSIVKYLKKDSRFKLEEDSSKDTLYELDSALIRETFEEASKTVNEICIKSWLEFEQSSQGLGDRDEATGYIRLEELLNDATKEIEDKKEEALCKKYAYVLHILNYCDQGKLNITCIRDHGGSYLKAGELGCLCVDKVIFNEKHTDIMRDLLRHSYYRYLFL